MTVEQLQELSDVVMEATAINDLVAIHKAWMILQQDIQANTDEGITFSNANEWFVSMLTADQWDWLQSQKN